MPTEEKRGKVAKIASDMADRLHRTDTVPRWSKSELVGIDAWANENNLSRPEAIRRLVELGLKGKSPR